MAEQDNNKKNVSSILNSKTIEKEGKILNNFMILEYNQQGSFTGRLNGKKAELENGYWILHDVTEYPRYSDSKFHNELVYETSIKYQDISNSLNIYGLSRFITIEWPRLKNSLITAFCVSSILSASDLVVISFFGTNSLSTLTQTIYLSLIHI